MSCSVRGLVSSGVRKQTVTLRGVTSRVFKVYVGNARATATPHANTCCRRHTTCMREKYIITPGYSYFFKELRYSRTTYSVFIVHNSGAKNIESWLLNSCYVAMVIDQGLEK